MSSNSEKKNTATDLEESDKFEALFAKSSRVLESIYKDLGAASSSTKTSKSLSLLNPLCGSRHVIPSLKLPNEETRSSSPIASTSAAAAKRRTRLNALTEAEDDLERIDSWNESRSDRLKTVHLGAEDYQCVDDTIPTSENMSSHTTRHNDDFSTTPIQFIDLSTIQSPVFDITDSTLSEDDDVIVIDDNDSTSYCYSRKTRIRGINSKKKSLSVVDLDETFDSSVHDDSTNSNKLKFTCPVCMERMVNRKPTTTKCGHIFCLSCITKAIECKKNCPICKTKLTQRMLIRIYL